MRPKRQLLLLDADEVRGDVRAYVFGSFSRYCVTRSAVLPRGLARFDVALVDLPEEQAVAAAKALRRSRVPTLVIGPRSTVAPAWLPRVRRWPAQMMDVRERLRILDQRRRGPKVLAARRAEAAK